MNPLTLFFYFRALHRDRQLEGIFLQDNQRFPCPVNGCAGHPVGAGNVPFRPAARCASNMQAQGRLTAPYNVAVWGVERFVRHRWRASLPQDVQDRATDFHIATYPLKNWAKRRRTKPLSKVVARPEFLWWQLFVSTFVHRLLCLLLEGSKSVYFCLPVWGGAFYQAGHREGEHGRPLPPGPVPPAGAQLRWGVPLEDEPMCLGVALMETAKDRWRTSGRVDDDYNFHVAMRLAPILLDAEQGGAATGADKEVRAGWGQEAPVWEGVGQPPAPFSDAHYWAGVACLLSESTPFGAANLRLLGWAQETAVATLNAFAGGSREARRGLQPGQLKVLRQVLQWFNFWHWVPAKTAYEKALTQVSKFQDAAREAKPYRTDEELAQEEEALTLTEEIWEDEVKRQEDARSEKRMPLLPTFGRRFGRKRRRSSGAAAAAAGSPDAKRGKTDLAGMGLSTWDAEKVIRLLPRTEGGKAPLCSLWGCQRPKCCPRPGCDAHLKHAVPGALKGGRCDDTAGEQQPVVQLRRPEEKYNRSAAQVRADIAGVVKALNGARCGVRLEDASGKSAWHLLGDVLEELNADALVAWARYVKVLPGGAQ